MDGINVEQTGREPQKAMISLILAIASLIVIAAAYPISYFFDQVGIVDFLSVATILAVAAIVLSVIARSATDRKAVKNRKSTAALVLGIISIVIIVLIRVAVFLLFIPMLGR